MQDYKAVWKAWCKKTIRKECAVSVSTEKTSSQYENNTQKGRYTINEDT